MTITGREPDHGDLHEPDRRRLDHGDHEPLTCSRRQGVLSLLARVCRLRVVNTLTFCGLCCRRKTLRRLSFEVFHPCLDVTAAHLATRGRSPSTVPTLILPRSVRDPTPYAGEGSSVSEVDTQAHSYGNDESVKFIHI